MIFKNPKWRMAAILKIKTCDFSATVWLILMKICTVTPIGPPD